MKLLISHMDSARLDLIASMLESAGVPCEKRNETLAQILPMGPFSEEIWVPEQQLDEAQTLLRAFEDGTGVKLEADQ